MSKNEEKEVDSGKGKNRKGDTRKRGEEEQGMGAGREKIGYASVGGRKKY